MDNPETRLHAGGELQRIAWACLAHWNTQPLPVEQRGICYTWIARLYRAKFHATFSPQKLAQLARMGILAKDEHRAAATVGTTWSQTPTGSRPC